MAGQEGMGQSTFEGKGIEDKYGFEQDTGDLKKKMSADDDEDDEPKKSEFLKVYKEEEANEAVESTELGEIKLRADDGLQQNPSGKPLVQEMSSTSFEDSKSKKQIEKVEAPKPVFDWSKAERVDAKFTFVNQGELVFLTFNFKGYNKENDVRYALSENEILIEVRDVAKNKVHRMCKTLCWPINSQESSVQLLVDYIIFKLKKEDKKKTWDSVGYDIQEFNIPETGYMRSNHLKQKTAEVGQVEDKENVSRNQTEAQTENTTANPEVQDKGYHKEGYVEP